MRGTLAHVGPDVRSTLAATLLILPTPHLQATVACAKLLVQYEACQSRIAEKARALWPYRAYQTLALRPASACHRAHEYR